MSQTLSQTLSQSPLVPIGTTALLSSLTSSPTTISNNSSMSSLSQNILSQTLSQSPQQSQTPSQPLSSGIQSQTQLTANTVNSCVKNPVVILDKNRLQELVQEVDPNEQLEEEVEEMLLSIADDFIESLVSTSAMFAKHRKSTTLDVKDVQLALEKNWKMWIPGFGSDDLQKQKKSFSTEAHKQRMALIKKTLKKF